jgi:predicted O-methyltransferase YrrM
MAESDIVANPKEYFRQLVPQRDELMKQMEREAEEEDIPIIGPVVGQLLCILASAIGALRILELGTATGYSAIYLAQALAEVDGRLITFELDSDMAGRARTRIDKAGMSRYAEVRVGDALVGLEKLEESFDLIFIDIEKADYIRVLPQCEKLLKPGGLLVADNVAFRDADAFNRAITDSVHWRAVNIFAFLPLHSPENDGLTLALRL